MILGLLETYHSVRSHLKMDTGVFVCARYHGPATLDKNTLYPALASLLKNHRILSTQVQAAHTKQPRYVLLKTVDLSRVVFFRDTEGKELREIVEFQFKEHLPLAEEIPLWRLIVLPDNMIIFHYSHSICDGQSGLAFHRLLLSALNTISPSQEDFSSIVTIPDDLQLHPPTEKLTKTSVSPLTLCKEVTVLVVPTILRKIGSSWTGNAVPKSSDAFTNLRLWTISSKDVDSLLKICRSHKCTLTSFIHTVAVVVFGVILRDAPKKYKYIATDIPVSLRRFTGIPAAAFCDHVSTTYFFPRIARYSDELANDYDALAKQFPWDDAAENAASLQTRSGEARELYGAMRLLFGQFQSFLKGFRGKKREGSFEVSNLGRFPKDPLDSQASETSWHIEDMFFGLCDSWLGPAIKLGVVGSQDGSVGLCFCWGTEAVEEKFAISFIDGVKNTVAAVLRSAEVNTN